MCSSDLASRQIRDGSFVERQELVHRELAVGAEGCALALSAYTLLALVETLKPENGSGAIEKGFDYLLRGQSLQEDPYVFALTTYVLSVARHPRRQEFMKKLEAIAVMDGDKMHLGNESSRALVVETTAYALLAYLQEGRLIEAYPIVKWLVEQRSPEGGFQSTQDTVVALTALGEYTAKTAAGQGDTDMQITMRTFREADPTLHNAGVDNDNALILQEFRLGHDRQSVDFIGKGHGLVLVQLTSTCWVDEAPSEEREAFEVSVKVQDGSRKLLQLRICVQAVAPESADVMAMMEVNLLCKTEKTFNWGGRGNGRIKVDKYGSNCRVALQH